MFYCTANDYFAWGNLLNGKQICEKMHATPFTPLRQWIINQVLKNLPTFYIPMWKKKFHRTWPKFMSTLILLIICPGVKSLNVIADGSVCYLLSAAMMLVYLNNWINSEIFETMEAHAMKTGALGLCRPMYVPAECQGYHNDHDNVRYRFS